MARIRHIAAKVFQYIGEPHGHLSYWNLSGFVRVETRRLVGDPTIRTLANGSTEELDVKENSIVVY